MAGATLGLRLTQVLRDRGMTPVGLARKAGATEATISNWLNDKVQPDHVKARQLYEIATAVQVAPFWLLLGVGRPEVDDQQSPADSSHPVSHETLKIALQLVSEVVDGQALPMTADKRAELTLLVCEMLHDGLPDATVIRFVRAAAA